MKSVLFGAALMATAQMGPRLYRKHWRHDRYRHYR